MTEQYPLPDSHFDEMGTQIPLNMPTFSNPRQEMLYKRLTMAVDVKRGIYPFSKENCDELTRDDISWLLEVHGSQNLDLRGAIIKRGESLANLSLQGIIGGISELPSTAKKSDYAAIYEKAAVHFEGANLRNTRLEGAVLCGAYLSNADMRKASLEKADFSKAHMQGVDLRGARFDETTSFIEASLRKADFSTEEVDIRGVCFKNADLRGAYFNYASLQGSDLSGAKLEEADFSFAHLEGATLVGAHLEGTILTKTCLVEYITVNKNKRTRNTIKVANLQEAFFDATTNFSYTIFSDGRGSFPKVTDVRWNGANLAKWDIGTSGKRRMDEIRVSEEREAQREIDNSAKRKLYNDALRANRQLSIALRDQGMNAEADYFAYHAQVCQHKVFRLDRDVWHYIEYLLLAILAGYGYRPLRSLISYIMVNIVFSSVYWLIASKENNTFFNDPLSSTIFSLTSFHGRGFFPDSSLKLHDLITITAAFEAFIGLIVETSFIAAFTQRFFGK